jgi:hypothetical protein
MGAPFLPAENSSISAKRRADLSASVSLAGITGEGIQLMELDQIVAPLNIHIVAVFLGVLMLAAWQIGRRMGRRLRGRDAVKPSKFDDASFGLLTLLLAFSFGTSIAKHDQRRVAVVADANAIGDFYTCASLLKEPSRTKLEAVIRQYAQLRLDLARRRLHPRDLEEALAKFSRMHDQMTTLVGEALSDGTPIAVSLANALNNVTSNQALRLAAYRDRLPASVVFLLYTCAIVTALLIGREQGVDGSTDVIGAVCFILLVSIAVYVTLDLNRPASGLIRVSQEPIEQLLSPMPIQ